MPVDDNGVLDMDAFRSLFSERTRLVSVCHVSNVLGTVNPVAEIAAYAHSRGAVVCVSSTGTTFSTIPARFSRSCHGTMLEWCSICVSIISSPGERRTKYRIMNTPYDVAALRRDFPILSDTVYGKPLAVAALHVVAVYFELWLGHHAGVGRCKQVAVELYDIEESSAATTRYWQFFAEQADGSHLTVNTCYLTGGKTVNTYRISCGTRPMRRLRPSPALSGS